MHVYPPVTGPHNPNLGHGTGMHGNPHDLELTSHNTEECKPGLVFVVHPQWTEPMVAGANIGNCYVVTEDGFENLSCHTPYETIRIKHSPVDWSSLPGIVMDYRERRIGK